MGSCPWPARCWPSFPYCALASPPSTSRLHKESFTHLQTRKQRRNVTAFESIHGWVRYHRNLLGAVFVDLGSLNVRLCIETVLELLWHSQAQVYRKRTFSSMFIQNINYFGFSRRSISATADWLLNNHMLSQTETYFCKEVQLFCFNQNASWTNIWGLALNLQGRKTAKISAL